jgi:hypothetical protein
MGIYAVTPGIPQWSITKPYFNKFTIKFEEGDKYVVDPNTKDVFKELLGIPLYVNKDFFNYNLIHSSELITIVPVIQAERKSFKDKMKIEILSQNPEDKIYYIVFEKGVDYSTIKMTYVPYIKPFDIEASSTIQAYIKNDKGQSQTISATFFKKPNNYTIDIKSTYNPQYHAGGNDGLLDGIFGTTNWRKGDWQGYQSQDFEAIVDLQQTKSISEIHSDYLQDQRSWILMPTKVEYYTSMDNINFTLVSTISNDVNPKQEENSIKDFSYTTKPINARYVKVKAYNFGKLPEWHQGFGGDAFIFIDEITIK